MLRQKDEQDADGSPESIADEYFDISYRCQLWARAIGREDQREAEACCYQTQTQTQMQIQIQTKKATLLYHNILNKQFHVVHCTVRLLTLMHRIPLGVVITHPNVIVNSLTDPSDTPIRYPCILIMCPLFPQGFHT